MFKQLSAKSAIALATFAVAGLTACGKSNSNEEASVVGGIAGGIYGGVNTAGCPAGGFQIPGRVPFQGNNIYVTSAGFAGEVQLTPNIAIPSGLERNTFSGTGVDGQMTVTVTGQRSIMGYADFNQVAADAARAAMYQNGGYYNYGGYNYNGYNTGVTTCITRLYVNMAFQYNPWDTTGPKIYGYTDTIINGMGYVRLKPASAQNNYNGGYNYGGWYPNYGF
jgi:hypothetical protein